MASETESVPLIRTKLYRPRATSRLVPRPRLLQRLEERRERPLTLVAAPAGYGKTTLISSWLEATDWPSAWVSLDEGDNDLVVFLTYLLAAVETMFPGAVSETRALLRTASLPPLPVLIRNLLNELDRVDCAFILVLDDCHHIHETAVHNLLDDLLAHPPRPMHLVIISRKDPVLNLTRYRARRQVTEVRTPDLRFTREEAAVFVQQEMGAPVGDSAVSTLLQLVEGWVTGLRLVILSFRHRGKLDLSADHLHGSVAYVTEYLVTEVLHGLPQAMQDYLLDTAILDRFCAPLCQAVQFGSAGLPSSSSGTAVCHDFARGAVEKGDAGVTGQDFVGWLEENDPFVVRLDDSGEWFRYHHIFQDLLQRRLQEERGANGVAMLHSRASAWFARNNLIDEALHHALAAGDTSSAVDLVVRHRHEPLNQERGERLQRWLNLLPKEAVEQEPPLLLAEAWMLNNQNRFGEMVQIVERVAAMLEADDSTLTSRERRMLGGEIAALRGFPVTWMGSGQLALELGRHALDVTPIEHEWVRVATLTFYIVALHLAGRPDKAYEEVHKMLAEGSELTSALKHRAYIPLVTVEMLIGNLSGAERAARQLLHLSEPRQLYDPLGWALYTLGFVYYQRHDLAQARDNFGQLVEWRYRINAGAATQGYVGLALTYQAMGDTDRANETCQAALAWAAEAGDAGMLLETNALLSRLALLQGQMPDANHWAEPLGDAVLVMLWLSIPHLTLANVLLAQGTSESLQEAAELLTRLRRSAEDTHNTWRVMEITALQALLKAAAGEQQAAFDLMEPVLAWAEPRGYIRLFADLGPSMALLLNQLRSQGIAPDYIGQILAAFPDQTTDLAKPLTPREYEVLALLAQGLSNKEIASEMVLATSSVKQYTHRIYQKLGVNNRQKAVQAARDLGIISAT